MKKINFVNGTTIDGASTFNQMQNNVEEVFNGQEAMGSIRVADVKCKNLSKVNFIRNINGEPHIYTTTAEVEGNKNVVISAVKSRIDGATIENPNVFAIRNIEFYNKNNQVISGVEGYTIYLASGSSDIEITVTTPENCEYMVVDFCNYNGDLNHNTSVSNIQIEYDKKTEYTPSKKFGYNSQDSMGKIVVDNIKCKNMFNKDGNLLAMNGVWGLALSNFINSSLLGKTITISINTIVEMICFGSSETSNRILEGRNTNKLTFEVTQELLDLSTERYLYFRINGTYVNTKDAQLTYEIQCELGTERTYYVEYKEFSNDIGRVLFEGVIDRADIPLNDNLNNYKYIEIEYGNAHDGIKTKKYSTTNAHNFVLENTELDLSTSGNYGVVFINAKYANSGTSLTYQGILRTFKYQTDANWVQDTNGQFLITKVIGYGLADTQPAMMSLRPDTTEETE